MILSWLPLNVNFMHVGSHLTALKRASSKIIVNLTRIFNKPIDPRCFPYTINLAVGQLLLLWKDLTMAPLQVITLTWLALSVHYTPIWHGCPKWTWVMLLTNMEYAISWQTMVVSTTSTTSINWGSADSNVILMSQGEISKISGIWGWWDIFHISFWHL